MTPEEYLRSGDTDGALAALQGLVRGAPSDAKLRIFLFQLLCVLGDWKRAIAQLKVCGELDPLAVPMAQTYREAIVCEVYREKVFAGEKDPLIFGEPLEWVALIVEAQKRLVRGRPGDAKSLRQRAFDAAPTAAGRINDTPFEWIADADPRLGPLMEMIVNGRYFWAPLGSVREIRAEAPHDLRDFVWTPATVSLWNGGEVVALIPTRYPGTVERGSSAAKLARATDWVEVDGDTFLGLGQRLLATDQGDVALMDLRILAFDAEPGASETSRASG
jgi:type VI secretion system protein ImpE